MTPAIKFRVVSHRDTGLKKAPAVLQKHLKGGLTAVGKRLRTSAQSRMRKDTGAEHNSLTIRVTVSGLNMNVIIFSTLVQSIIDAYGLPRGVFPNFAVNSSLYNWAKRKLRGIPSRRVKTGKVPKGLHLSLEKRKLRRKRIRGLRHIRQTQKGEKRLNARQRFRAKNSDVKRLTFLVARAIYRHGRKGTYWHTKTMEANKQSIIREMKNALSRSVNEINRG